MLGIGKKNTGEKSIRSIHHGSEMGEDRRRGHVHKESRTEDRNALKSSTSTVACRPGVYRP
jgi:hypothetical protein